MLSQISAPVSRVTEELPSPHRDRQSLPKLTIVIPALNEEESIGQTVQRCLDAHDDLVVSGQLRDIEVIVVNDGSTDRTSEIAHEKASRNPKVAVIDFPKNRGYGAALKTGFEQGTGELVSFLDADGTCDPMYFGTMCHALQEYKADVVLGSRMGKNSEMPRIRRLGNRLFAFLLGFLSGRAVTDTASGMRVIRRESLERLYPLPDGLQFTPAMSARAILDNLTVVEVDMEYSERIGESKLHAFRDGIRFLMAIMHALLLFRPSRLFNLAALVCLIVAVFWGLYPVEFYLRHARLEEWMIYRVLLCTFLASSSLVFLSGSVIAEKILSLVHPRHTRQFVDAALEYLLAPKHLVIAAGAFFVMSIVLVWPGLIEYLRTSHTSLHWSRAIVAVFLLQLALVSLVSAVIQCIVDLWNQQSLNSPAKHS